MNYNCKANTPFAARAFILALFFFPWQMVIKALNYQKVLKDAPGSLPFEKTITCNIGNPQVRMYAAAALQASVLTCLFARLCFSCRNWARSP
jgi:hypothetical protein